MNIKIIKAIVIIAGILCASSTMAAPPSLLFFDNFNCENTGATACDYSLFKNWDVGDVGNIDLVTDLSTYPKNSLFLDFGGACTGEILGTPDALTSKTTFTLYPDTSYILGFDLGANPLNASAVTVQVSLGAENKLITLENTDALQGVTQTFHVDSTTSGKISFSAFEPVEGSGSFLLDNVALIAATDGCETCMVDGVTASPIELWPANHKMKPVRVNFSELGDCDQGLTCDITSVSSNEPVNGLGDGDTGPDWLITGDLTVNLRAERSGAGIGRIYTITLSCTDAFGNRSTGTANVTVPHDKGKKKRFK